MEDKQTRLLVWLVGILAVLVAVIVVVEPSGDDDDDDEWGRAWPEAEATDVSSIVLDSSSGTVELSRVDDGWRILRPVQAAADRARAESLVEALVGLEVGDPIESDDRAAFGLADPTMTIDATLEEGDDIHIVLGKDTPVGWGTYVDLGGEVRSTRARASSTLARTLEDLRSKELLEVSRSGVDRVEITRVATAEQPAQTLVLRRDEHGWWLEQAGAAPRRGSEDAVTDFVSAVLDLRVDRFGDGPAEVPDSEYIITLSSGEEAHILGLGPAEDDRRMVQAPLQEVPVEVVSDAVDELLEAPAEHWLSTRLLPLRPVTLDTLKVKLGDRSLEAHRSSDGWDEPGAEDLLGALQAVRVDRSVPAQAEGEPWGTITLSEGDARTEELRLHQATEDGGRVAVDAAGGLPFVLPATELRRLGEAL